MVCKVVEGRKDKEVAFPEHCSCCRRERRHRLPEFCTDKPQEFIDTRSITDRSFRSVEIGEGGAPMVERPPNLMRLRASHALLECLLGGATAGELRCVVFRILTWTRMSA